MSSWPYLLRMRILLALAISLALTGCSSMLYYPAKDHFTDPTRFRHKPQAVFFASEDGVKLHGWHFRSPNRPAKATLLFFHGNAQNISTHFYSLYWMLDQGFDYFIFDYRGYGFSEGQPSPEGTIKDGQAALKWILKNKEPGAKLILFAQSLGGAVALRVACEEPLPHSFDAIVVDSTFPSYRKAAQKLMGRSWLLWSFQWLAHLVLSDEHSPKNCIDKISPKPLLVVHGTEDQTIDITLGEKVFELAREPKEFWRVEGGKHTDFLFRENFAYQKKLVEWIAKVSPPRSVNE